MRVAERRAFARVPGALVLMMALGACGFESLEEGPTFEMNVCSEDRQCDANAVCREGMCVAESADDALNVVLEIAPLRAPDGSPALPYVEGGFVVDGPLSRDLQLPLPVEVSGQVRNEGKPIQGEVSFALVSPTEIGFNLLNRGGNISLSTVTAAVGEEARDASADFRVRLLSDAEYRMRVRTRDGSLPPITRQVVAQSGASYTIDYDDLALERRELRIDGPGAARALRVKAVDQRNGETLSSTAALPKGGGDVDLLFPPQEALYQLVITAEEQYDDTSTSLEAERVGASAGQVAALEQCDLDAPTFPTFNVASAPDSELDESRAEIWLPEVPERIHFEGWVELCDNADEFGRSGDTIPISLRSRAIAVGESETAVQTAYSTTTNARYDEASNRFRFCVALLPGEYEVVVAPPKSTGCGVFAERRMITPPPDETALRGPLLALPNAVELTGELRTNTLMPLQGAMVSAIALGRSDAILPDTSEARLTQFNRSRETLSGEDGEFALVLDQGAYDVIVKPPQESGFPWQVHHDITFNSAAWHTTLDMRSPVSLHGSLAYRSAPDDSAAQASLEGAVIRAFAIIDDPGDSQRAIAIGRTTADPAGDFTLLLPPTLPNFL